jgi:flagella basal body P-ring formation protein FlgA
VPGTQQSGWRIRFLEAAVISGPVVTLGEVAVPVGEMPAGEWQKLAGRTLWPAPPENGKAVNMTRPRLQEAVVATMNDLAPYCLFPGSMALQRGGALIGKEAIQAAVVKSLTPLTGNLTGECTFKDFRLPAYIFTQHAGQTLDVEPPRRLSAGRANVRLLVRELDGSVVQRISGSLFLDCWTQVPAAAAALNRDDVLSPDQVTFIKVNLAHLRGEPWDGRGGPWRLLRSIGVNQVIYRADLGHLPAVKKGDAVTILYEGKSLRLSVQGEAMTDGVPGESIPVRNLQSKKQIFGIVRDSSTVVVQGMQ